MQRSLFTATELSFWPLISTLAGLMAAVGQEAMARGISHILSRYSWSSIGGLR
jgi:hypothetical protein